MSEIISSELVAAIPALAGLEVTPELQKVVQLFETMTTAPVGLEETNYRWSPDVLKIKTATSQSSAVPGNAVDGDIYASGNILWNRKTSGGEPMRFVAVFRWVSQVMFDNNYKPLCRSDDSTWNNTGTRECATCEFRPFKDEGVPNKCQRTQNYLIVPTDLSGIYHVAFSKTSYGAGSSIYRNVRGKKALWHQVFGLSTKEATNNNGNRWQVFNVAPISGEMISPELDALCYYIHKEYSAGRNAMLLAQRENRNAALEILEGGAGDLSDLESSDDDFSDSM